MTFILNILLFILVCLIAICLWIMIWDSNRFVTVQYHFSSDKVQKPIKFVFLSDLHNKEYGYQNQRLLAEIDKIGPDVILVGGDILTAKPRASFEKAAAFIKQLSSKYKIYYALGNHEYRAKIYPETYGALFEEYIKSIKNENIIFLDNDHVNLEQYGICITGLSIDKYYYKRFIKRKMEDAYLRRLLGEPRPDLYQILLAHNPEYFSDYSAWTKDLVLSGHVHGGVAKIPFLGGVIAPSLHPFPHYDGGLFEEFDSHMILSRGLGMHTIPVRFLNPGELVEVQLEPAGNENNEI